MLLKRFVCITINDQQACLQSKIAEAVNRLKNVFYKKQESRACNLQPGFPVFIFMHS